MGGKNSKQKQKENAAAQDATNTVEKPTDDTKEEVKAESTEPGVKSDVAEGEKHSDDKEAGEAGNVKEEPEKADVKADGAEKADVKADGAEESEAKPTEPVVKADDGEKYDVNDITAGLVKSGETKDKETTDNAKDQGQSAETATVIENVDDNKDTSVGDEKNEPDVPKLDKADEKSAESEQLSINTEHVVESKEMSNEITKSDSNDDNIPNDNTVNEKESSEDNNDNSNQENENVVPDKSDNVAEKLIASETVQDNAPAADNCTQNVDETLSNGTEILVQEQDEHPTETPVSKEAKADPEESTTNESEIDTSDNKAITEDVTDDATADNPDVQSNEKETEVVENSNADGKEADTKGSNKVSAQFKWEDGGESVEVSGSFNAWGKVKLEKKDDDVFKVSIDLEPGEYLYKYIVDGDWKISNNQTTKAGDDGIENNFIEVKME